MIFTRFARTNRAASNLALALALASGAAVGSLVLEAPAAAAKKDKKEKAAKGEFSPAFVEAYRALDAASKAETPDWAAVKAGMPALIAASQSADERLATGSLAYNAGVKLSDDALTLQGMEMMLASGKLAAEQVGQYNFVGGQLAFQAKDFAKARTYFQAAIDAGYVEKDTEMFVAESYFAEDKAAEGLAYLSGLIDARRVAGQPVSEAWLKRGLAMAYNNKLRAETDKFSSWFVSDYPSETSWGDAVAILLNTAGYQNPEILDLLRLGQRAGALRDSALYMEYVDAADYRRLPAEVVAIIDEGYAKGKLDKTDPYVVDTRKQAAARAATDKAEMNSLLRDANKAGATVNTVLSAGDALLGVGRPADAETVYTKALGIAGVNTPLVLTRLGIAQFDQGKYSEAQATFNKVEGARKAIANLWAIYALQKAGGGM